MEVHPAAAQGPRCVNVGHPALTAGAAPANLRIGLSSHIALLFPSGSLDGWIGVGSLMGIGVSRSNSFVLIQSCIDDSSNFGLLEKMFWMVFLIRSGHVVCGQFLFCGQLIRFRPFAMHANSTLC